MSKAIKELGDLWDEYLLLTHRYDFPSKYQSYDENAYDGDGAYGAGAEGFLSWIADGCPGRQNDE
jgi:hypothetical protein